MALWPAKKDQDENNHPVKIKIPDGKSPSGKSPSGKSPSGKSHSGGESGSGETGPGETGPGGLNQLTERLAELGNMLGEVNQQILAYLMHRDQQATADADDKSDPRQINSLSAKLDALTEKLDNLAAIATEATGDAPAASPSVSKQDAAAVSGVSEETLRAAMVPLQDKLDQLAAKLDNLSEVVGYLHPPEPDSADAGPAAHGDWQGALLGKDLAEDPALIFQRQQLLDGTLNSDPASCSLVGQLLVFRSAPLEKMPQLLKEVGEAYYRWQPKTTPQSNPMEDVLVTWLKKICDEKRIGNSIELVHPGERFDSARHSAATRGVEISEVRGWIVLRDNGKVYTKANVVAQ